MLTTETSNDSKIELRDEDGPCQRCGKWALDTGWECTECGYDNMPWFYPEGVRRKEPPYVTTLLREARDFVGKSRCPRGHSVTEVVERAKHGPPHCIYCEHQVALFQRLSAAVQRTEEAAA